MNLVSEIEGLIACYQLTSETPPVGEAITLDMLKSSGEFRNVASSAHLTEDEVRTIAVLVWRYIIADEITAVFEMNFPFDYSARPISGDSLGAVFSAELLSQTRSGDELAIWLTAFLFRYKYCWANEEFLPARYLLEFVNAATHGFGGSKVRKFIEDLQLILHAVVENGLGNQKGTPNN